MVSESLVVAMRGILFDGEIVYAGILQLMGNLLDP